MERPYIICHMTTSIDGKVTGEFLGGTEGAKACEVYYEINRDLKSNGFICGRITMEGSFTGGHFPDLSGYQPVDCKTLDYIPGSLSGFFAVAFDTYGRLGWKSNVIVDPDGDPGYDGAQIIEVLSQKADGRYLAYLRQMQIPYIFAGEDKIDVELALSKLKSVFGIDTMLLEGGSILNGAFLRAGVIDELSLVIAPTTADKDDKPLFTDGNMSDFELVGCYTKDGVAVVNYRKKGD